MKYLSTVIDVLMIGSVFGIAIEANMINPGWSAYIFGLCCSLWTCIPVNDIVKRHNIK